MLPSLLLNYAGQTGILLDGGDTTNPFFRLVPDWGLYPLVGLAALAPSIAAPCCRRLSTCPMR